MFCLLLSCVLVCVITYTDTVFIIGFIGHVYKNIKKQRISYDDQKRFFPSYTYAFSTVNVGLQNNM